MLRIGTAGWSYRDWEGIVYPRKPKVDPLSYLSQFFDTIEINSTFYGPPTSRTAESWVRRIEHNHRFRFTVKLWQNFTHQREGIESAQVLQWKAGVFPILESESLGAVLIQYPWSFKNTDDSRRQLAGLLDSFSNFPLVVEFRHRSWNEPAVYDFLHQRDVGICNIDQPVIGNSIPPQSHLTSQVGYLRCHGRNYRDWFREGAGRDARYNYLYNEEELDQQKDLIRAIEEKASDVYAVYNNHYRGQAAVNALQLRDRLEGKSTRVPELLANHYKEVSGSGFQMAGLRIPDSDLDSKPGT